MYVYVYIYICLDTQTSSLLKTTSPPMFELVLIFKTSLTLGRPNESLQCILK